MSSPIKRLFVNGFPSLYGGAGTELHHQIIVWRKMGVEVHLIPSWDYHGEPLYNEMVSLGVIMHAPADWSAVQPGDPVLGFCNAGFLNALPEIRRHTKRTVFINCMTWLFPREKEAMQKGEIAMFLYQNEAVRQEAMPLGPNSMRNPFPLSGNAMRISSAAGASPARMPTNSRPTPCISTAHLNPPWRSAAFSSVLTRGAKPR